MFSNNNQISIRQIKMLLILDLFSTTSLILPKVAADAAGRDGWIAILIGTVFAGIYAFVIIRLAKKIKGNFIEYCKGVIGKLLTYAIALIYLIKFTLGVSFGVRLFGELIKDTLLPDTSIKFIIAGMLLVSAYGASKGLEGRGRIAEILIFIVFIPITMVLIFAFPQVDIKKITPILTTEPQNILMGSYSVLVTYSALEFLLFAAPFVRKPEKLGRSAGLAIGFVSCFNLILFLVTMGVLGELGTKKQLWSSMAIMQVVKLPGGFVERQDALMISFWILSIFAVTTAYIFYLSLITKHIFSAKEHRYLVLPFLPIIYFVSLIPSNIIEGFNHFSWFMAYIGMPTSIGLPIVILFIEKIVSRFRRRRGEPQNA